MRDIDCTPHKSVTRQKQNDEPEQLAKLEQELQELQTEVEKLKAS